jgi:hypothetical protein
MLAGAEEGEIRPLLGNILGFQSIIVSGWNLNARDGCVAGRRSNANGVISRSLRRSLLMSEEMA